MKLYEPSTIKLIKNKFGFRFSKSLGQNFLIDKSVIDSIVEGAGISEEDLVIEDEVDPEDIESEYLEEPTDDADYDEED